MRATFHAHIFLLDFIWRVYILKLVTAQIFPGFSKFLCVPEEFLLILDRGSLKMTLQFRYKSRSKLH